MHVAHAYAYAYAWCDASFHERKPRRRHAQRGRLSFKAPLQRKRPAGTRRMIHFGSTDLLGGEDYWNCVANFFCGSSDGLCWTTLPAAIVRCFIRWNSPNSSRYLHVTLDQNYCKKSNEDCGLRSKALARAFTAL